MRATMPCLRFELSVRPRSSDFRPAAHVGTAGLGRRLRDVRDQYLDAGPASREHRLPLGSISSTGSTGAALRLTVDGRTQHKGDASRPEPHAHRPQDVRGCLGRLRSGPVPLPTGDPFRCVPALDGGIAVLHRLGPFAFRMSKP